MKELTAQICQICGDEIEFTEDGEPFVACNECAFPICRSCYEYERREGNQSCPQCKTRYKRIKGTLISHFFALIQPFIHHTTLRFTRFCTLSGSPRVDGDEDEDEFDDLDREFDYNGRETHPNGEGAFSSRHNIGRTVSGITNSSELDPSAVNSEIPLLTYGQEVDLIHIFVQVLFGISITFLIVNVDKV